MNLTHLERQLLRHIGLGKPVNHSYHFGVLTYRSGAEVELASAIQCDGITLWEGRFYVGELAKQRLGGYMHPGENRLTVKYVRKIVKLAPQAVNQEVLISPYTSQCKLVSR
jgi:hypothetical protein